MYDIDWKAKFINSRALDYIAFRCGFWYEGHRSTEDCLALIHILTHEYEGKSYFQEVMEKIFEPAFKIIVRDTEFSDNEIFKEHKFRWDSANKYWFKRNVPETQDDEIREMLGRLTKYSATKKAEDPLRRYKE